MANPLDRKERVPGALWAVIALSVALNATAVWWGLPSRYGWAPDEIHPRVIREGIDVRFSGDWHQPAYPPLHYYVLALADSTPLAVAHLGLFDPAGVLGTTILFYTGRAVSLVMALGIVLFVYRLGREAFDETTGIFAALATSLLAPFVYYSKTANLDVPLTFWVVLSLVCFVRFLRWERRRDLLAFTLSAVAAMGTKDQAYAFYVLPVAFYLGRRVLSERPALGWTGSLRRLGLDRDLWLAAAAGTAAFLAVHNVVFNFQGFVHHFEEILWARGHYGAFGSSLEQQIRLLGQSGRHLVFSMGWPLALLGLAGVCVALRERSSRPLPSWILLSALSYYALFIAPVQSTWLRYVLPVAVILSPFVGRGLKELASWSRPGAPLRRFVLAAVLLYSLGRAGSVNLLLLTDSRYAVERWLAAHVEPHEVVGYVGPEYYLPRLEPERTGFPTRRLRPTSSVLARQRPEFLAINAEYAGRFSPESREGRLFQRLRAGRTEYALVHRDGVARRDFLLDFEGVVANLDKVSPLIEIYERSD